MNDGIKPLATQFASMPRGLLGRPTPVPMPNASRVFDRDAAIYIAAVEDADKQPLEEAVRVAIGEFVIGCKEDNIWGSLKASCLLMGARTLSGALVPLVGASPTNINFVSGDYSRKTGLIGNGTTKYLSTNRSNSADPQNNHHNAVYVSSLVVSPGGYRGLIGGGDQQIGASNIFFNGTSNTLDARARAITAGSRALSAPLSGLAGTTRSSSGFFVVRGNGISTTYGTTSQAPANITTWVFAVNNNGTPAVPTASRMLYYSTGESLDLARLDSRVANLSTAISSAIP